MTVSQKSATSILPNLIRTLRQPSRRVYWMYDQINLITKVQDDELRFEEFDDAGFKVNGVKYEVSVLCVGNLLLSWKPRKFLDVTLDR